MHIFASFVPSTPSDAHQYHAFFERFHQRTPAGSATHVALWRDIALLEYQIDMMTTLLQDFIAATQAYIEKKQSKTWQEIEAELEAAEEEALSSDSESDSDNDKVGVAGGHFLFIFSFSKCVYLS
jgi:hypothetical protein